MLYGIGIPVGVERCGDPRDYGQSGEIGTGEAGANPGLGLKGEKPNICKAHIQDPNELYWPLQNLGNEGSSPGDED